jgi:hypothetical protein
MPRQHLPLVQWARNAAKQISTAVPSADAYFRSLPKRRSLRSLLADRSIWISFASNLPAHVLGITAGKEIGITQSAFNEGRLVVLGVLIHELAHVNGAPKETHAAEEAVLHCGLGHWSEKHTGIDNPHTPYIPGHIG